MFVGSDGTLLENNERVGREDLVQESWERMLEARDVEVSLCTCFMHDQGVLQGWSCRTKPLLAKGNSKIQSFKTHCSCRIWRTERKHEAYRDGLSMLDCDACSGRKRRSELLQ